MSTYIVMFLISFGAFCFCNYVAYAIHKMKGPSYLVALDMFLGFIQLPFVIYWATKIIGEA